MKNPAYVGSLCETRSYEEELQEERAKCEPEEIREETLEQEIEEEKAEGKLEGESEEEVAEEIEEEKQEAKEEEALAEEAKEDDETDKRFNEVEAPVEAEPTIDNDYIKSLIEELIESKLAEIKNAEVVEEAMNQELQMAKDFHEEVEKDIESQQMAQSAEVLRLRLQLLKLKDIKRGI